MAYSDTGYLLPNLNFDHQGLQNRYGTEDNVGLVGGDLGDYRPLEIEDGLQTLNRELTEDYMRTVAAVNETALKFRELGIDVTNPDPRNETAIAAAIEWRKVYDDAVSKANRLKEGRELEKNAFALKSKGFAGNLPTDKLLDYNDVQNMANLQAEGKLADTYDQVQQFGDQASVDAYNTNVDEALGQLDNQIAHYNSLGNAEAVRRLEIEKQRIIDANLNQLELDKLAGQQARHDDNMALKWSKENRLREEAKREEEEKQKEEEASYVKPRILKIQNGEVGELVGNKFGDEEIGKAEYNTSGNEAVIKLYSVGAKDDDEPFATIPMDENSYGVIGNMIRGKKSWDEINQEPEPSMIKEEVEDNTLVADLLKQAFTYNSGNKKDGKSKSQLSDEITKTLKDGYTAEVGGSFGSYRVVKIFEDGVEKSRFRLKKKKDFEKAMDWLKGYMKPELIKQVKTIPSTVSQQLFEEAVKSYIDKYPNKTEEEIREALKAKING